MMMMMIAIVGLVVVLAVSVGTVWFWARRASRGMREVQAAFAQARIGGGHEEARS